MQNHRRSILARIRDSERGSTLVFASLTVAMLGGMVGFATDIGYVLYVRRIMQTSTDTAATAGAIDIGVAGKDPVSTALSYSAAAGKKNTWANAPVITASAAVKCTNFMSNLTTGAPCTSGTTPANTIVVTQLATVPMHFARLIGLNSVQVKTVATATMRGGAMPPLDVMVVIDTTASMAGSCTATVTGVSSPTRLDCAKAGVRALLSTLWPCQQGLSTCGAATNGNVANPIDRVGLSIFPGLKSTTPVANEYDCTKNVSSSNIAAYGSSPVYLVVPLSSDFRTSTTSGLNGAASKLVKAADWADGNTCTSTSYGLEAPGGQGSYFADAITSAQATLVSTGRAKVQDVIVFVSDGNATQYSGGPSNPCRKAITAAQAAATAGTWVYSVAYGASTSSSCTNDSPAISSYATMQQIASDPSKFFSQPSAGDLTATFQKIGQDLMSTRLIDDATP